MASALEGATLDRRNMTFQRLLCEGYTLRYETAGGQEKHEHIYFLDFERPELNDWRRESEKKNSQPSMHRTHDRH